MPGLRSTNASKRLEYLIRVSALAIATGLFLGGVLWAQTASKTEDSNKSWTTTTEAQGENVNPTRTTESHTQSGNRTVDKQSVERRGSDGRFEPFQDIETETVKVDAHTVRTVTRSFARNSEGAKTLVQVTEEQTRSSATGDSNMVRTVSNPDVNGRLQVVQRQVGETKQVGKGVEETKTTVMLPSINGGLAPAMKTQERRTTGANDTVESQKTTLLPDGSGNFQVSEIRQAIIKQDGKNSSSDERVSRPGSDGKLSEISRTVSRDSEGASGEKRSTVDTYSLDVPGSTRDGSLHLVERATTSQRTSSTGQQTTEQQVERPNPGDSSSHMQVITLTTDTVNPGASGAKSTRTVRALDANGSFGVVSVDTSKSDNIHAIQVQIGPSDKPK